MQNLLNGGYKFWGAIISKTSLVTPNFFCRFDILIWSATLCENFIKSVSFLQKLKMTRERP